MESSVIQCIVELFAVEQEQAGSLLLHFPLKGLGVDLFSSLLKLPFQ